VSTGDDLLTVNSSITQLMRRIRRVDEAQGVGRARLSALAVLYFGGSCSPSELAAQEMVSRATMHHVLKGLEADGYVVRREDPDDARRQVVQLTRLGTRTIRRAHRARIDYYALLARGVSAEDLAVTARTLDTLRRNARERGTEA
jgi:DNA-binding MarR family transcriptional regulator